MSTVARKRLVVKSPWQRSTLFFFEIYTGIGGVLHQIRSSRSPETVRYLYFYFALFTNYGRETWYKTLISHTFKALNCEWGTNFPLVYSLIFLFLTFLQNILHISVSAQMSDGRNLWGRPTHTPPPPINGTSKLRHWGKNGTSEFKVPPLPYISYKTEVKIYPKSFRVRVHVINCNFSPLNDFLRLPQINLIDLTPYFKFFVWFWICFKYIHGVRKIWYNFFGNL